MGRISISNAGFSTFRSTYAIAAFGGGGFTWWSFFDRAMKHCSWRVSEPCAEDEMIALLTCAQRLKRVYNFYISLCPFCSGTLRLPFTLKLARINWLKCPGQKIKPSQWSTRPSASRSNSRAEDNGHSAFTNCILNCFTQKCLTRILLQSEANVN